ncbi:hypothetical protein [Salinibacter altiplanensis]|uniref:hypothetical protein n=1 Tax=Salinibacter altiplanensis TaxID=1803181 RepID=UPI000C9ED1A2|nr:hypothetical protein [Salinibacter altiplanensis]
MSDETSTIPVACHLSEEQREKFIEMCSRSYPLSEEMIGRFPLLWDWEAFSQNESLEWSIRWDWASEKE